MIETTAAVGGQPAKEPAISKSIIDIIDNAPNGLPQEETSQNTRQRGSKIITGPREAIAGDFSRVTGRTTMKSKHPIEEWKQLWDSGVSFSKIAKRYGVTRGTVASVKFQLTKPDRVRKYVRNRQKTYSVKEWRKELQFRNELHGHLLDALPYYSKKWRILRAYLDGKTSMEIGEAIGLTGAGAFYHLKSIGIKDSSHIKAKTRALSKVLA